MPRRRVLCLVLLLGAAAAVTAQGAEPETPAVPVEAPCPAPTAGTTSITAACRWQQLQPVPQGATVRVQGTPQLPLVALDPAAATAAKAAEGAATLVLQRLVLAAPKLVPPGSAALPPLWPLGLFDGVGARLNISDVRLVVDQGDLQAYVEAVQQQPPSVVQFHTDGSSFLHIAVWRSRRTQAHSVTLLAGPCSTVPGAAAPAVFADLAAALAAAGPTGCNVRAVDNSSLVPTLRAAGGVATPAPLLVLVTSNVSLGHGLRPGAINVRRPVVLAGLHSVPTSVDLGMTVNQINATSKHAKVFWQSLFIENAAPGNALSSLLSRPMSSAVSAGMYAVYCDRLHNCVNLHNCTVVLASQAELDYVTFMYSMFNSPLPSMRNVTAFYRTELKCVEIQMGPGPGGMGMFLGNLSCRAWDMTDTVFTTQPRVAKRLPFPENAPLITAATKAGPLVQAVRDCASLQAAMGFPTVVTRLHVWMLLSDVRLAPPSDPNCWRERAVNYPTQLYGQQQDSLPVAGRRQPGQPRAAPMFVLDFDHIDSALVLPPAAEDKFLTIHNTSLQGLPQGPAPRARTSPGRLAPDVFTLLLWSVNRTQSRPGSDAVLISDVVVGLPQPEYDFIASRAAQASSFAVTLEGSSGDMTFTSTELTDQGVRVILFDGPGLLGSNMLLKPVPVSSLPAPAAYFFPPDAADYAVAAQQLGSPGRLSGAQVAGVVVGAIAGALLLTAAACRLLAAHRRRRQRDGKGAVVPPTGNGRAHPCLGARSSRKDGSGLLGGHVGLDVTPEHETLPVSAVGALRPPRSSKASGTSASHDATGSLSSSSSVATAASGPALASSSASDTVSTGMERWRAAASSTTQALMERRLALGQGTQCSSSFSSGVKGSFSGGLAGHTSAQRSGQPAAGDELTGLVIHTLVGQGSFGSVWLGTWMGKRCAVKIMQLPATGLLSPSVSAAGQEGGQQQQQQRSTMPVMGMLEAVVSSTMSHPNVVQAYTYCLTPLSVERGGGEAAAAAGQQQQQEGGHSRITGYELKLVMQWMDEGTLREALDSQLLLPRGGFLPLKIALSLAHDVTAALLHLHNQGIVHGDLKAANVMLTRGGDDDDGSWLSLLGFKLLAKVCDFGLAIQMDPSDTHATMAARGTPTHMSPELFMSGHVSKASDVFALGILLFELITGRRAYAGIPVPLLPHEVAVRGVRPCWPQQLPAEFSELRLLAEACWAQLPQDRPTISEVFNLLDLLAREQQEPAINLLEQWQQQHPQQQHPQESAAAAAAAYAAAGPQLLGGRASNLSWSEVTVVAQPVGPEPVASPDS